MDSNGQVMEARQRPSQPLNYSPRAGACVIIDYLHFQNFVYIKL